MKSAKLKSFSVNGTSATGRSVAKNGSSGKKSAAKKSINEQWIEKYGVDDSKTARKTLEMWKMVYEAHKKPKP